jgi:hypothetical protein
MSKPRIFINYRREDSAGYAGRLKDRLSEHFGQNQLFMDISTIEPGVDFSEAIKNAVVSCDVMLVLIGKEWLTIKDDQGRRRLDKPEDFVRLEIATALKRNIRVIPVRVRDATMPAEQDLPDELKKLARRQAIEVSDDRWEYDVERLIRAVKKPKLGRVAIYMGFAITLVGILVWVLLSPCQRDSLRLALGIGPDRHSEEWEDRFLYVEDPQTRRAQPDPTRWDYPNRWEIVKEPFWGTVDGALLLKGLNEPELAWGVRRVPQGKAFYDFKVTFNIRLSGAAKARWGLRWQPDKRSGYVFELIPTETTLLLKGEVCDRGQCHALAGTGPHDFCSFGPEDTFTIEAIVTGFDFHHTIKLNGRDAARPCVGRPKEFSFKDDTSRCRFGTVGLIGPNEGDVVVEDFMIQRVPGANNQ